MNGKTYVVNGYLHIIDHRAKPLLGYGIAAGNSDNWQETLCGVFVRAHRQNSAGEWCPKCSKELEARIDRTKSGSSESNVMVRNIPAKQKRIRLQKMVMLDTTLTLINQEKEVVV